MLYHPNDQIRMPCCLLSVHNDWKPADYIRKIKPICTWYGSDTPTIVTSELKSDFPAFSKHIMGLDLWL